MDCLICGTESAELDNPTGIDGTGCRCPECGEYFVSRSLLAEQGSNKFSVDQTRAWLERQRDVRPDEIPRISTMTVRWGL